MNMCVYQNKKLMDTIQAALEDTLEEGERVIRRDAFRWKDHEGNVLSNHYEMFSIEGLAAEFGYEIIANFNHIAVIKGGY